LLAPGAYVRNWVVTGTGGPEGIVVTVTVLLAIEWAVPSGPWKFNCAVSGITVPGGVGIAIAV